ncbi:YhgE/Pip domain-containing protein [Bifidobacterium magnum]|uniref:Phage infection protein n=1 Tax=Bifidobacterium magnum TaxID=1692 RepID=A0A087BAP5_9BIFI|nr:YhgE/Pip domain-containing protein [Bifidobacterium magnum]KFI68095.1 Phage infection protein [Bifidobacterium magnum]
MSKMIRIFLDDVKRFTCNVVSIIILIGLVVIPGLFTWFNVGACWDPFANTGNLKFAIANEDTGYTSDLLPVKISIGDEVVNSLRANSQLDWSFTSPAAAIDGTKSGKYYAAVVIPKDFSKTMMTFFSTDAKHATLDYYDNEKLNALAPKVTGQGADTIAAEINEMFAKTITGSALSIASSIVDHMDTPQAHDRMQNFNTNVSDLADTLNDGATALQTYSDLTGSAQTLLNSSTQLVKNADSSAQSMVKGLQSAKSSVDGLTGALNTSVTALGNAFTASATSFGSVNSQLDNLFTNADNTANSSATSIRNMATQINTQAGDYQKVRDSLAALAPQLKTDSAKTALNRVLTQLDSLISLQHTMADDLNTAAQSINDHVSNSDGQRQQITDLATQAKSSIDSISNDFNTSVKPDLTAMNAAFTDAASSLTGGVAQLKGAFGDLSGSVADGDAALTKVGTSIGQAATAMKETADRLTSFKDRLQKALNSGDIAKIKDVLNSDTGTLATILAAPVQLKTKAVFPVANFGTALTPFYTFIPLWVGSLLLAVSLKTNLSKKRREQLGNPKPYQIFLGHYGIFALVALMQITFSMAGTLLFLRVHAVHPLLFLATGWLSAIVYSFFIYTMVVSFGSAGKAIGILFLVMQMSGANGAYPLVLLPKLINDISPFLPMTYSVTAFRGAIAGIYQNDYWIAMGRLVLFIVPLLLIGLILRKPLIGFNRWIVAKTESTHLIG